ncbi:MAG: hypothetical protein WDN30_01810 [Pararobbsia sp.]
MPQSVRRGDNDDPTRIDATLTAARTLTVHRPTRDMPQSVKRCDNDGPTRVDAAFAAARHPAYPPPGAGQTAVGLPRYGDLLATALGAAPPNRNDTSRTR